MKPRPVSPGERFSRLTVQEDLGRISTAGRNRRARCICDCGQLCEVAVVNLRTGNTRSCGCLKAELDAAPSIHGHSRRRSESKEYRAWKAMITRCTNPKAKNWDIYGGRGISVCPEWRESFSAFFGHIGQAPSDQHTVDRKDGDGNYEPGNVRWATRKEQQSNRRDAIFVQFNGQRMRIHDVARITGKSYRYWWNHFRHDPSSCSSLAGKGAR